MRKVGLESYMQWLEWCRDAPHLDTAFQRRCIRKRVGFCGRPGRPGALRDDKFGSTQIAYYLQCGVFAFYRYTVARGH